jgi:hypothetical protein
MPSLVLENIQVVRIAVACELHKRPMVAKMLWGPSPCQVLRVPGLGCQAAKFTTGQECRNQLDGVKALIENNSSMFRIALLRSAIILGLKQAIACLSESDFRSAAATEPAGLV